MNFDIFVTAGPNDFGIVKNSIKNNQRKIDGLNKTYLFSEFKNFNFDFAEDVSKDFFPFSKEEVEDRVVNKSRAGWIYQQLLCLYYPYLQKNSEYTLVIDSDVFFTKDINFFEGEKGIFTVGYENHQPYFKHMNDLHPKIKKVDNFSGISHHMLFKKTILESLFELVENYHNKEFYKSYIDLLDPNENSPSADYEIYYNYALNFYKESYTTRELNWTNLERFSLKNFTKFDMVSLPHWKKTRPSDISENIRELNFIRFLYCIKNFFFLNTFYK
tara:strand:- start:143 stop:961 length:819 start_codon:yes stop_codon:yes gene_type:complete